MPYRKILVIRQSALGDVANTLPVLQMLRRTYPEALITCLTAPLTSALLSQDPCVDQVISLARTKNLFRLGPFWWRIFREKFDLVIDLQSSRHSRWLTLSSGAGTRLGHGKRPFYTDPVDYDPGTAQACELFLKIMAPLGVPQAPLAPRFPNLSNCRLLAEKILRRQQVRSAAIAVLNPGHSPEWLTKRWPSTHWEELIDRFAARGITPVITGGPGEAAVAERLCEKSGHMAISLAGKTSLDELAGIMALARVVVSTDSGPMHVAAMAGASVVALFGPTNPLPSGPLGDKHHILHKQLDCSLCFKKVCPYQHECLDRLLPDEVWLEVEAVLKGEP